MLQPLQMTFRNLEPSPALETRIRKFAERLDRFYGAIVGCRVVVDRQSGDASPQGLYRASVDLRVPGASIASTRSRGGQHAHEDPYVAVRNAFDAITRLLESHARRQRRPASRRIAAV